MNEIINKIPLIGILCFIGLYVYATTLYPGGSQASIDSIGFDWMNNYWCDLLVSETERGDINPARTYAITATLILCFSLMIFFVSFAQVYISNVIWRKVGTISGMLSMMTGSLIFTDLHNQAIVIASFFGLFVGVGIIIELYKSDLLFYKVLGVFCIVLLVTCNYIYYSKQLIELLPILQKVMMVFILSWVLGLNIQMNRTKS